MNLSKPQPVCSPLAQEQEGVGVQANQRNSASEKKRPYNSEKERAYDSTPLSHSWEKEPPLFKIIDYMTREEVTPNGLVFTGDNHPWEIVMNRALIKQKIHKDHFESAVPKLSKYLPLMPIKNPGEFISLRENATPLIKSKRLGKTLGIELYFKLEGRNPTGSFKDRGSAVDISVAKEAGAEAVILASTGNMAASCACYAAAAKLPCFVVVPEGVAMAKLAQVISYGGKIIQVKGSYNDAARLAHEAANVHGLYLAGDYAFRVEGQKTAAFELFDQMAGQVPDRIIIPIGCGTNMAAYAKGIEEYQWLGMITKQPKLVGVQSSGANAVVNSYRRQSSTIEKLTQVTTIASAIAVPDPIDGVKALNAIHSSGGEAYDVSDKEILEAQYLLATEEGLFVESASAATLAYLLKRVESAQMAGETVVCILTGDGLKDPNVVLKSAIKPPTIAAKLDDFTRLYQSDFFASKTMVFTEHDKVLLDSVPDKAQLSHLLFDLFGIRYADNYLERIDKNISDMLKKGKALSLSDIQDSLQDALEQVEGQKRCFSIIDFNVYAAKDKRSTATVMARYNNKLYSGHGEGVGPVDAAVQSLCDACNGLMKFELKNYNVDIRSHGTDAIVYVEMKLLREGVMSLGCSASPDIIQASLAAFENAYNGLFLQQAS